MRSSTVYPLVAAICALTASAAPASNPSLANSTVVVSVGDGGVAYSPDSITANVGDVILFEFRGPNHTVTQTSFGDPCTPFSNATTGQKGFDSGFMSFVASSGMVPFFQLEITSTDPIWIACMKDRHCQSGMVMAINPTADKSLAAFKTAAMGGGSNGALARVASSGWTAAVGAAVLLTMLSA